MTIVFPQQLQHSFVLTSWLSFFFPDSHNCLFHWSKSQHLSKCHWLHLYIRAVSSHQTFHFHPLTHLFIVSFIQVFDPSMVSVCMTNQVELHITHQTLMHHKSSSHTNQDCIIMPAKQCLLVFIPSRYTWP